MKAKLKKPAIEKAVEFLAIQPHSTLKLKQKLKMRDYDEEEIEETVSRLTKAHYLDDESFCRRSFEILFEEKRQSVRQICQKLIMRGFDKELVRNCIPQEIEEHEKETALFLLKRKFTQPKENEKMQQYLYQKGFGSYARQSAINAFLAETDISEE